MEDPEPEPSETPGDDQIEALLARLPARRGPDAALAIWRARTGATQTAVAQARGVVQGAQSYRESRAIAAAALAARLPAWTPEEVEAIALSAGATPKQALALAYYWREWRTQGCPSCSQQLVSWTAKNASQILGGTEEGRELAKAIGRIRGARP